jgi:signal transduction histidine kinase
VDALDARQGPRLLLHGHARVVAHALADSGQLSLERTPTDLPALVQRVVERFQPQASARKIDLQLASPPLPAGSQTLNLDPQRIEQVLSNLLSNALRHTPDAGRIDVRISALTIAPGGVQITIQDSGPGIPPEALRLVFERFYRADRARSRLEGGSGLGLAIARQLAEAHGGTLTASNHPGGGAVFTLTLPV